MLSTNAEYGPATGAKPATRETDDAPAVHVLDDNTEPTAAELSAIEAELPVILADVDLLDALLMVLDRTPTEMDARRIRRARRRALAVRRDLANATGSQEFPTGGAA
jgi:hypothetical protein